MENIKKLPVKRKTPQHYRFTEIDDKAFPIWCKLPFASMVVLVSYDYPDMRAYIGGHSVDMDGILDRNGVTLGEAAECALTNYLLEYMPVKS